MTDKLSDNLFSIVSENWKVLQDRIEDIKTKNGIKYDITVCAATKTVPVEVINFAAGIGLRRIGENRVNEFLEKYASIDFSRLTADFIGTLQTNKINKLVGRVSLIQTLDSEKKALEINCVSAKKNCVTDVLVEINSGREPNKSGIMPEKADEFLNSILELDHVNLKGIMTMGPVCEKKEDIRKYFEETYHIYIDFFHNKIHNIDDPVLSMGMSSDYDMAIKCGANMIRPGTALFGSRSTLMK